MHNVKRVHLSPEAIAAKKLREQSKIKEYLALTDEVVAKKKSNDWSRDTLDLTTRILRINPEFFTAWNYRRNILLSGIFPERYRMTHPKVYWIWNHRRWCLENTPSGPEGNLNGWRQTNWDREMFVVDKMLDADSRNFMAWDYRRYCLVNMPVPRPETAELAYTTRKIEANFSNFSAWHQRSKVLSSLWASGKLDSSKSREDEFELVRNAMYTDPNDQSVWIYHRWLIGGGDDKAILDREIGVIQELLDEQSDSKWCMDSLVHYKRLLLKNHSSSLDVASLQSECRELLGKLRVLDPARQRRYEEIGKISYISVVQRYSNDNMAFLNVQGHRPFNISFNIASTLAVAGRTTTA
ncbi:rab-protein geranylgeranyltransferase [Roridomyces roridus]|uniref:Geranylgeranyl transferase type-2 subunit alpha n=1 Tax=Roridomyces roridus TaxID=1738132 RepID=A0AAD7FLZ7_9AGAR|nr:rab-protein geranylgeranyltransferase [Roridomyces roridus]